MDADPIDLIDRLDAAAICEQIRELDRRRRALAVLLCAARARERAAARATRPAAGGGAPCELTRASTATTPQTSPVATGSSPERLNRADCPGARPVLVVHDEIVLECPQEQAETAAAWLQQAMLDGMAPLIHPVPVEVEVNISPNWAGD
jgi:hypothetical protein